MRNNTHTPARKLGQAVPCKSGRGVHRAVGGDKKEADVGAVGFEEEVVVIGGGHFFIWGVGNGAYSMGMYKPKQMQND